MRARVAGELLARHYEGASSGYRTKAWRRSSTDANAAIGPGLARLRDVARDLVRNNPWAAGALNSIVNETIGWGLVAKSNDARALAIWEKWALTTECDADRRHDIYGLQKLALRTIVESGEVLIRRRFRLPVDGLTIPIQLQILEPDYLDTAKDMIGLPNGGRIVQGVEFSPIGERVAYWLFREHPGSSQGFYTSSYRVPAENILHIFRSERPGQVRAPSWFAPVLLKFKDFDEYDDATLMKQKIAACLAVMVSDADGTSSPLGSADDGVTPSIDSLSPGMIANLPPGRNVTVIDPPSVADYAEYSKTNLRAIAKGLGVLYENMTGDHTDLSFSAARMSRIAHQPDVEDWRWRLMVPGFCDPVWRWMMEAAAVMGEVRAISRANWSAPPLPFIDPSAEGLAIMRNARAGITSMQEAIRERGGDPKEILAEIKDWNTAIDKAEIILDSDPRKMTQAGQAQAPLADLAARFPATAPAPAAAGEPPAAGATP